MRTHFPHVPTSVRLLAMARARSHAWSRLVAGIACALLMDGSAIAQSSGAPQAPKTESLRVSDADMQVVLDGVPKDAKSGKPGAFSKRLFEASTFSTALIRLNGPDQPHAHGIWSEIFVIKEGSGTVETGGTIIGVTGADSATHRSIFLRPDRSADATPAEMEAARAAAARRAAQGDKSGTDISGGRQVSVGPGDVLLIPAGVAHRWTKVNGSVVYLDVKFPKAE